MRKELRACMEARDVFQCRRLRVSDGAPLDAFEEIQVSSVIGRTIMSMGLCDKEDVDRLVDASHWVEGTLVFRDGAKQAFRDKVWSRLERLSPPLRDVERVVARSALPHVADLLAEAGMIGALMDVVDSVDASRAPHARHHVRLRRFHTRAIERHYRSIAPLYGAGIATEFERRVGLLRSTARWLRKQVGAVRPSDAMGDDDLDADGAALAAE